MRAVAAELGMATMSLYRYVTGRAELEGLLVDLVLADVDITPPPRAQWPKQLTVLVERMRDTVAAHPGIVPLTLIHRHTSTGVQRWSEAVLRVLTEAGFTGPQRVVALRGLLSYLIGAVQLEHLGPLAGAGTSTMVDLPKDEYPLLAETARHARRVPAAEEFRRGLTIMLTGLQASLGDHRT